MQSLSRPTSPVSAESFSEDYLAALHAQSLAERAAADARRVATLARWDVERIEVLGGDDDAADTTDHTPYDGPTDADRAYWADFTSDLDERERFDAWELDGFPADYPADPWQSWNSTELQEAYGRTA